MPRQKVEFIGRKREIDTILASIFDWNTQQCLFIDGAGGVGKTSLIGKVSRQLTESLEQRRSEGIQQNYQIFNFDLDDIRLQSPAEICIDMIKVIGAEKFRNYFDELITLHRLEQIYSAKISEQKRIVDDAFIAGYTNNNQNVRTVIFCDTVDVVSNITGQNTLEFLMDLSRNLVNTIVIFSGQNLAAEYKTFAKKPGSTLTKILHVKPFSLKESLQYLRRKEELLHIVIDPDIEQKLVFLTRGVPFLIDLAAEREARENALAWVVEESLKDLRARSESEISARQTEFEAHLVQYIEQQRQPTDRLALVLAWVHPVDVKLSSLLLDLTEEQAGELIINAQNNTPYIKTLPNQQIKLHDYMEQLILNYIWEDIEEDRKKRESKRAAQYFQRRLRELHEEGTIIRQEITTSQNSDLSVFLEQQKLGREYWQVALQLLKHILIADFDQGIDIYCQLFDEAYDLHQVAFLDRITDLIKYKEGQMSWTAKFEVAVRYVDILLDQSEYSDVEKLMNELLTSNNITPVQEIRALIKRGNAKVRVSHKDPIQAGMDDFYKAIQIASENKLTDELGLAELEVGWAYSNFGDWSKADERFARALEIALKSGDKKLEAKAFNELAYIRFYDDPNTAISYCNNAIQIWLELGDKDGLARSYSNMGTIYYRTGEYENARDYFQKSLDIFEQANRTEWIARVSSWQGITYYAQSMKSDDQPEIREMLLNAENLVTRAIKIGVPQDSAQDENRLSRIYRAQGNLEGAWNELLQAYNVSLSISNSIYEVASIRDLSSLALELERFNFYQDLKHMITEYKTRHNIGNNLAYGSALVNIGIMAIYRGESDYGFRTIAEGLKCSAESSSYANYGFSRTLNEFDKYVKKLVAPSERGELAEYLKRYWDSQNLSRKYLVATSLFYKL